MSNNALDTAYVINRIAASLMSLTTGVLMLILAFIILRDGLPYINIEINCCKEIQCEEPIQKSMDELPRPSSTPDPYTPIPISTNIQIYTPTATSTGYVPDPSSTPTDIPRSTSTPEPSNTPTPEAESTDKVACNRGGGNGPEDCDPGNSSGRPGNAGENDG